MIPAGKCTVRGIKGSEQYGNTEKGTPQIGIDLEIIGGELEGATATTVLYFSEAAQQYSIARLRALGWAGDDLANLDGIDSAEAIALVKYETWEGEERMRIEIMTGGGGMKFKTTMNDQQKRMFAASMKPIAAASKPKGAPAQSQVNGDRVSGSKPSF